MRTTPKAGMGYRGITKKGNNTAISAGATSIQCRAPPKSSSSQTLSSKVHDKQEALSGFR
jgi:hypothetical protein